MERRQRAQRGTDRTRRRGDERPEFLAVRTSGRGALGGRRPPGGPPAARTPTLSPLADVAERFADRWQLRLGQYFNATEISQVAAATRADSTPCVLKVSRDLAETRTE